jgi:hypothetical protein
MWKSKLLVTVGGGLLVGLAGLAQAASASDAVELRQELTALQERVHELEARKNSEWLNERRAEEVKTLIHEVLSDADTRASLMGSGLAAGYDDGFYLSSEDGGFLLRVDGRVQVRTTWNERDDDGGGIDENERGTEVRRANLTFSGQIDSGLSYSVGLESKIDLGFDRLDLDHAWISHNLSEDLAVRMGEFKGAFLHEELTSASHQLAAERSLMNEVFTAGRVQGLELIWTVNEDLNVVAGLNDGSRSGESPNTFGAVGFDADATDAGLGARADLLLSGGWDQFNDFTAEGDDPTAIKIGGAIHYEAGETGEDTVNADSLAWTIDLAIESQGLNGFVALAGLNEDADASGVHEQDMVGVVAQVGYRLTDAIEPFVRYEWIDLDGGNTNALAEDELNLLTIGANYYMNNHAAKVTLDVVYALDSIPAAADMNGADASGLGLLADDGTEDDQMAVRLQFQLLF